MPIFSVSTTFETVTPQIRLFDELKTHVYTFHVESLTKDELVQLLDDLGFHRKPQYMMPLPEKYRNGASPSDNGITFDDLMTGNTKWSQYGTIINPHDEI
ncbi:hypothetical protein SNE40_002499 [Patella caerulea]|uniref:Uncharacterized protein n=1 Tax=Patella caerulea TaxID=87958 RepID=A0AAN8K8Q3_PATCE